MRFQEYSNTHEPTPSTNEYVDPANAMAPVVLPNHRLRRGAAAVLAVGLGLTGCDAITGTNASAENYIDGLPAPHNFSTSIPRGKVLPTKAEAEFADGAAAYTAPDEVGKSTGLYGVTILCGNPVDGKDATNLYAEVRYRDTDLKIHEAMSAIVAAKACADGVITEADRPQL
jgi:hypothetical protein